MRAHACAAVRWHDVSTQQGRCTDDALDAGAGRPDLLPIYLTNVKNGAYITLMLTLRRVQELQDRRSVVRLADGRVGKIIRVDTTFPANKTEVSVYTMGALGPGVARVSLELLTGESEPA